MDRHFNNPRKKHDVQAATPLKILNPKNLSCSGCNFCSATIRYRTGIAFPSVLEMFVFVAFQYLFSNSDIAGEYAEGTQEISEATA